MGQRVGRCSRPTAKSVAPTPPDEFTYTAPPILLPGLYRAVLGAAVDRTSAPDRGIPSIPSPLPVLPFRPAYDADQSLEGTGLECNHGLFNSDTRSAPCTLWFTILTWDSAREPPITSVTYSQLQDMEGVMVRNGWILIFTPTKGARHATLQWVLGLLQDGDGGVSPGEYTPGREAPHLSRIPADINGPPVSALYAQVTYTASQAALLHSCTVSAHSSPASVRSCTTPTGNACCITYSYTLADAMHLHGAEEGKCSGKLHLHFEKHCTVQMSSNMVNLRSVGLVSHPAHATAGNSWLNLHTPHTLELEDQGVATVLASNTSARGQPATFPTSGILLGTGFGSACALSRHCSSSSTTPTSLQNERTIGPLLSTWQATFSLALLPGQCG